MNNFGRKSIFEDIKIALNKIRGGDFDYYHIRDIFYYLIKHLEEKNQEQQKDYSKEIQDLEKEVKKQIRMLKSQIDVLKNQNYYKGNRR